jgi:hypothetical protein
VRYRITDVDAIADALHNRKPAPLTPLGGHPGCQIASNSDPFSRPILTLS